MADRAAVTYLSHAEISHMRRTGERHTMCGRYFPARMLTAETVTPAALVCGSCTVKSIHTASKRGGQP